jgi:hypothetical protein
MTNPKPQWIEARASAARLAGEQRIMHRPITLAGVLIPLLLGCGSVDESRGLLGTGSQLVSVNEIHATNQYTLADQEESTTHKQEYNDWIELYNASEHVANLEGYFITDNPNRPSKHVLPPEAVIPGKGFLILWADNQPAQGPFHLSFALSNKAGGESVYLADPKGNLLDGTHFESSTGLTCHDPIQQCDFSYARYPDGSGAFAWCEVPTPGASNGSACAVPASTP